MAESVVSREKRQLGVHRPALALLALLVLTLLLWLPFGFNVGPTADDWFFFANAERGLSWGASLRPLLPLPHWIGAQLTPGSFVGSNLVLAALLWLRAVAVWGIVRKLGFALSISFAAAALTLVLPIDTGVFYRGALTVYVSGAAYLLAVYWLLVALERPRPTVYFAMWLCLLIAIMSYEAQYPLILITPALLWLTRPALDKRWRGLVLRWFLFPSAWAVYYALSIVTQPSGFAYQASLRPTFDIGGIVAGIGFLYQRHVSSLWQDVSRTSAAPIMLLTCVAAALIIGGAWLMRNRAETAAFASPLRRALPVWTLIPLGLVIIGAAAAIYLPTALRFDTLRTYFVSTVGMAFVLVGVLAWLETRLKRAWVTALILGVIGAVGMAGMLDQHQTYRDTSNRQQAVLTDFGRLVPMLPGYVGIAVIDRSAPPLSELFVSPWHFPQTFIVLYDDPTVAVVHCPQSSFERPLAERPCQFTATGLRAVITPDVTWERPYDRLIVVEYADQTFRILDDIAAYAGSVPAVYDPDALIERSAPLPPNACTLFTVNDCR